MRILNDPGHGGKDTGAVANGLVEKDLNLQTAKLARDALLAKCAGLVDNNGQPVEVMLTREDDSTLERPERLRRVAAFNPDICVSIHYNAAGNPSASGTEIFHSAKDTRDDQLAQQLFEGLKATGMPSRGMLTRQLSSGEDYYYIIREVMDKDTIALLYEGAFLTNVADSNRIKAGWINQAAEAIAQAVFDFIRPQMQKAVPAPKGPGVFVAESGRFFAGIMHDGRMYTPVRAPFEALGLKVDYNSTTQIATIRR